VFNLPDWEDGRPILETHAQINPLINNFITSALMEAGCIAASLRDEGQARSGSDRAG
jgi:hypothetical protein